MSRALRRRTRGWLLLLAALAASPALAAGRFGWRGLPPVSVGFSLQQAEAALGAPLATLAAKNLAAGNCQRRGAAALPGVVFVVDNGLITRIETRDPRYATLSGIRVGDDVAKARRTYGQWLRASPHAYFERGLSLSLASPDRRFALVMESNDSGRIITLRAGLVPQVQLLEGCSP